MFSTNLVRREIGIMNNMHIAINDRTHFITKEEAQPWHAGGDGSGKAFICTGWQYNMDDLLAFVLAVNALI